jgi:hypothetical protein
MRCEYACGDEKVRLDDVWGSSTDDCKHPGLLRRAGRQAAQQRMERQKKLEEGR